MVKSVRGRYAYGPGAVEADFGLARGVCPCKATVAAPLSGVGQQSSNQGPVGTLNWVST